MKRALLTMAVVLSALLITGVSFAHMGGYGNSRGYGSPGSCGYGLKRGYGMMHYGSGWSMLGSGVRGARFCLRYGDELELSEKQVKALEDLNDEFAKAYIEKRADLEELQIELNAMLDEDKIDLSKVKSLNSKIAALQGELRYMRIEEAVKAKALLNEEQLDRLGSSVREYRGRGEGSGYCPYD